MKLLLIFLTLVFSGLAAAQEPPQFPQQRDSQDDGIGAVITTGDVQALNYACCRWE